jgi:hypothetical protein
VGFTSQEGRFSLRDEYPPSAVSGTKLDGLRSWSLVMFQIPAYDPIAIMMMGFGVLLVAALAFVL